MDDDVPIRRQFLLVQRIVHIDPPRVADHGHGGFFFGVEQNHIGLHQLYPTRANNHGIAIYQNAICGKKYTYIYIYFLLEIEILKISWDYITKFKVGIVSE